METDLARCVAHADAELIWRKSLDVESGKARADLIELKPLRDARDKDAAARRELERVASDPGDPHSR